MFLILGVILLLYVLANIYLAYKFLHIFQIAEPFNWLLAAVWFSLAICPLVFRNDLDFLPGSVTDFFYLLGSYWIALIYYGILLILFASVFSLLFAWLGVGLSKQAVQIFGVVLVSAVFLLVAYGSYNAAHPKITYYTVDIEKKAEVPSMRVALVSDLHLGKILDEKLVDKLVALTNSLEADVLILAGDVIDSDIHSVYRKAPLKNLKQVKTAYGIYGVMGNHEYIQGEGGYIFEYLKEQGIKMLLNQGVLLPNGVYLYGRDDYSHSEQPLVLQEFQRQPILVVDHQPRRIEETKRQGADFLFSGHTHQGQLFPNNLLTAKIYEIDYGLKKFGDLNVLVTSGIGTWGPPVRLGNTPEIVCLDINFNS